jgi:UDP-glucuronate decarboxylase
MNGFFRALIGGPKPDIYNVGNPTPEISMSDLAKLVCATSKSETEFELVKYPSSYPEDEPNRRCPNISKISMSLGYKPAVTLEEGLKRFLEWASINYTSEYL